MLQSVLLTGITPLSNMDKVNSWENRPFRSVWPEPQRNTPKGTDVTKTIQKKSKRIRTAFTTQQLKALEKAFSRARYIDVEARKDLSKILNLKEKSIKIWFQNRRMKEKKDMSEGCDSSNESSSAMSPPLLVTKEFQAEFSQGDSYNFTPQNETQYHFQSPDSYNVPMYQNQVWNQNQNYGNAFLYDNTVYPSNYYPSEIQYSTNNNYQQDQFVYYENQNNWSGNGFGLGYNV